MYGFLRHVAHPSVAAYLITPRMPSTGTPRTLGGIDDREEVQSQASAHLKETPENSWPVETRAHECAAEGGSREGGYKSEQGGGGGGRESYLRSRTHKTRKVTGGESKRGGVGA